MGCRLFERVEARGWEGELVGSVGVGCCDGCEFRVTDGIVGLTFDVGYDTSQRGVMS